MENNQSQNSEISGIDSIRPISNESFGHILPQQSTAISNAAAAAALSNYTRMLNFQNQLNLISLAGPAMELNPLALAWNNRSKSNCCCYCWTSSWLHILVPPWNAFWPKSRRKGGQVRFTTEQTNSLEARFDTEKYLSPNVREYHLNSKSKTNLQF